MERVVIFSLFVCLVLPIHFARAEVDVIHVEGTRASAVMEALQGAGAHAEVIPEILHLRVNHVACYERSTVRSGQYYQCNFEQISTSPPANVISTKRFRVIGQKAKKIIFALRDTGLRGEPNRSKITYSAAGVNCEGHYFGARTEEQCAIDISR